MTYIAGFLVPVPRDNKHQYLDHANAVGSVFIELGARQILESWEDDIAADALRAQARDLRRLRSHFDA